MSFIGAVEAPSGSPSGGLLNATLKLFTAQNLHSEKHFERGEKHRYLPANGAKIFFRRKRAKGKKNDLTIWAGRIISFAGKNKRGKESKCIAVFYVIHEGWSV